MFRAVKEAWFDWAEAFFAHDGREVWISDGVTTEHLTADGIEMYVCHPPPVENDQVVLGGLAMLSIECYGKLVLVIHSIKDVVVKLNKVAHVPGLGMILFYPHAVGKRQVVVIDPVGVHVTPWRLFFPSNEVGSQLSTTRKVHTHQ